jgi:pimeloyl-ACP methyl ester carboxylesterase/predicted glycosyltransferase
MTDWKPTGAQSRAVQPCREGFVEQGGVQLFYEVYGEGEKTLLFVPPWAVVHSRVWKAQIAYFARQGRVVVYDPRGNGRSDRPRGEDAYSETENARDIAAVMDATGTRRTSIVTFSRGCQRTLLFAATDPDRVEAIVFIAPGTLLDPVSEQNARARNDLMRRTGLPDEVVPAVAHFNREAWQRDPRHYRAFLDGFFEHVLERHSTKGIEDGIGWGLETDGETLAATHLGWQPAGDEARALCARIRCPTLVIHDPSDQICRFEEGVALSKALETRLEVVEGAGHLVPARKPVQVNLAIRELLDPRFERKPPLRRTARRGPKRALFVSSPIGLGHARRDVAIARQLRKLVPGLEIDWLAQHPVTRMLEAEGETLHPASGQLASESAHIESESAEHDLHCFQALRRMDEIQVANFMVFHEVTREGRYDLTIGDEAWEVDYFLHENPDQKRAPYVWLTDFVGLLPMQDGGDHEAFLAADANEEMIGHIERHPQLRDRALFVGNPEDVVSRRFGPELPWIREWTERHFEFSGYITGFDPAELGPRDQLRDELGYRADEKVCIVTVGGSGVGRTLLERVIAAHPAARRREPALRTIVVAGPRIDPAGLPKAEGLEVVSYVHHLHRHLAACDLAVVQGGLTTAMELAAAQRPFLYFPLKHHFEQNIHVRHRLDNYGAGRCMDYDASTPEDIADAMATEIGRPLRYRSVETDGARRAAERIAELL